MTPKYHRIKVLNSSGQTMAIGAISATYQSCRQSGGPDPRIEFGTAVTEATTGTVANAAYGTLTAVQNSTGIDRYEYTLTLISAASANGLITVYVEHSVNGTDWPTAGAGYVVHSSTFGSAVTKTINFCVSSDLRSAIHYQLTRLT